MQIRTWTKVTAEGNVSRERYREIIQEMWAGLEFEEVSAEDNEWGNGKWKGINYYCNSWYKVLKLVEEANGYSTTW